MEENYLISLFVAFVFGVMFFKKDSEKQTDAIVKPQLYATDSSGLSGVAKYLENKRNLDISVEQQQSLSGVAKYLSSKDEASVSSVSKYMARQVIQSKEMAKLNVSGVEQYLNNRD